MFLSLHLLASQLFLPIALANAQLEWPVRWIRGKSTVVRITTVTHHDVAYGQIQQCINRSGPQQDTPGQPLLIQIIGNEESKTRDEEKQHAQPMREGFFSVQLRLPADGTGGKQPLVRGCRSQTTVTGRTMPLGRGQSAKLTRVTAFRTIKNDFHGGLSKSKKQACVAPQQLPGELAQETEDHSDVEDSRGRLRGSNACRSPSHPSQNQWADEADSPANRQPQYGYIRQVSQGVLGGPGPESQSRDSHT